MQITLKAARVNAGLSQDDVSRALKISKQTVINWEKNRTEPTVSQMRQLMRLYSIDMDNIFLPVKSS